MILVGGGTPTSTLLAQAGEAFPRALAFLTYAATEAGSTVATRELSLGRQSERTLGGQSERTVGDQSERTLGDQSERTVGGQAGSSIATRDLLLRPTASSQGSEEFSLGEQSVSGSREGAAARVQGAPLDSSSVLTVGGQADNGSREGTEAGVELGQRVQAPPPGSSGGVLAVGEQVHGHLAGAVRVGRPVRIAELSLLDDSGQLHRREGEMGEIVGTSYPNTPLSHVHYPTANYPLTTTAHHPSC
ncbi:hypothetical protein T492DRAFT_902167 [Pavlovales sp. CCMP2436]|nr:hypothetical protein T492DRAFT_902167 [Pavlovales sp. CCMP2436]